MIKGYLVIMIMSEVWNRIENGAGRSLIQAATSFSFDLRNQIQA